MLDLLKKCFPENFSTDKWQEKIEEMIPSFGKSLITYGKLMNDIRKETTAVLKLED